MIAKRVDKMDLPHPRTDCNYLQTTIAETPNNVSIKLVVSKLPIVQRGYKISCSIKQNSNSRKRKSMHKQRQKSNKQKSINFG